MHIKEFMFRKQLTTIELAKHLECSRQLITQIRRGVKPSRRFARDLEKFSEGLITMDEILNPKPFEPLPVNERIEEKVS